MFLLVLIVGVCLFLGMAWVAQKVKRRYLTWLVSALVGLLVVCYSFSKNGFEGMAVFVIGVGVVMLGVIGSARYQSTNE